MAIARAAPPAVCSLPLFRPTPQLRLPFLLSLSNPISFSPKYPLLRLRCAPADDVSPLQNDATDGEDDDEVSDSFSDPLPLASYTPTPYFDEGPEETEEQITAGYEELYGPAYSSETVLGGDINIMNKKKAETRVKPGRRSRDGMEERVLEIRRVQKVVKGGRKLSFRVVVIIGDKQGHVGVGVAQAKDSITAVQKAVADARRRIITVPLTKDSSFPHRANGKFGAATVMLRPARPGSGVSAGGTVRLVLELAGVLNALGKQLRSDNAMNNARATIVAMRSMRSHSEVAAERGITLQEMWQ